MVLAEWEDTGGTEFRIVGNDWHRHLEIQVKSLTPVRKNRSWKRTKDFCIARDVRLFIQYLNDVEPALDKTAELNDDILLSGLGLSEYFMIEGNRIPHFHSGRIDYTTWADYSFSGNPLYFRPTALGRDELEDPLAVVQEFKGCLLAALDQFEFYQ